MSMDQRRLIPAVQMFLDCVIADKLVDIPIQILISDETVTLGT